MILNRFRIAAVTFIAAIFAALHLPVSAQSDVDPYEEMHSAIQSGIDQGLVIENSMDAIRRQYSQIPQFIQLEAQSPGFVDAYVTALRPVFEKSMLRSSTEMKGSMIALFRREFTPEQALEIAAHYRTDAVQRLMGNVSRNFAPDSTLSEIDTGAPITEKQIDRDISRAAASAAVELSAEDAAEINAKLAASPTLRKFEEITPKIIAIRTAQENKPLLPEEEAELEMLAEKFFAERFGD